MASVALAASLCLGSPDPPARGQSATERAQLDRLRAGLQKYQDPVVAIPDGYFSTLGCIVIDKSGGPGEVPYEPGGMGVHFLNVQAIAPVPDPDRPQVLIYEPRGGKLQLVAAEWFIPPRDGRQGAAYAPRPAVRRPDAGASPAHARGDVALRQAGPAVHHQWA